MENCRKG